MKKAIDQRHRRVDRVEADGAADGHLVLLQLAGLHQGRVEVQVVRHDGRPDDADGHDEHAALGEVGPRHGAAHLQEVGPGLGQAEDLDRVADADGQRRRP